LEEEAMWLGWESRKEIKDVRAPWTFFNSTHMGQLDVQILSLEPSDGDIIGEKNPARPGLISIREADFNLPGSKVITKIYEGLPV
jgi:hypothetical protein